MDETPPKSDLPSNVVDIGKFKVRRVEQVYECPCGSQHFYMLHPAKQGWTGDLQCRICDTILPRLCWGERPT